MVRRHAAKRQREKVGSINIAVHLDTMRLQLHRHHLIHSYQGRSMEACSVTSQWMKAYPTILKTGAPT